MDSCKRRQRSLNILNQLTGHLSLINNLIKSVDVYRIGLAKLYFKYIGTIFFELQMKRITTLWSVKKATKHNKTSYQICSFTESTILQSAFATCVMKNNIAIAF